jgi:putative hydrolase of the HAD superfamily
LSDAAFDRAHFEGIRAIHIANAQTGEDRRIYLNAYLSSLGIPEDKRAAAVDALDPVWSGPSPELWRRIVEGSIAGLQSLYDAGLKLGIVSNSDGHAEEALICNKICQVGSGEGVPVLTIVDSAVVGVAKPDPAIFDFARPLARNRPKWSTWVTA